MTTEIVIGGDSVDIPAGTYPATLATIETKQSAAYGDFRAWNFTLDNGSVVGGATSMNTGRKSKGGQWIAALLGRKPDKDETVQLAGLKCLVVVIEDDNGWPKVDAVLPPMGANQPAAAASPSVAAGQVEISDNLPF